MLQFYQNIYLSKRINNYSTIIKINFLKYSLRLTNFVEFLDIMIDSDVWKEKKLYGKVSMGVVRTTYIIDENGYIEKVFEKAKPDTNAAEILEYLENNATE